MGSGIGKQIYNPPQKQLKILKQDEQEDQSFQVMKRHSQNQFQQQHKTNHQPDSQNQLHHNNNQQQLNIEQLLNKGFKQIQADLIQKRVSLGRRSVSLAQNAGTIQDKFLDRKPLQIQPKSHDQKVILSKGQDSRKKVQQNFKYPFCSIGYICMDFLDSQGKRFQGFGSGCLIHKRIVLTCAHNVYDRQRKIQAYQVYFVPAMCGSKGKRYKAIKFYYPKQYKQASSKTQHEWDFALMQLDAQDLSQQYGYLGVNTMMNGQQNAMIYGYPVDLNNQPGKKWLFGTQGLVRQSKRSFQQLNYDMPTAAGQSGSPIIRKVGKNNYQVIGVHIRYIEAPKFGKRDNVEQNCNSGVKFTDFIKNMINNWVKVSSKELTIQKKTFTNKLFKQLMQIKWDKWAKLTRLNLSQNNINSDMLYYITSADKRYPNLLSINVSDNNIQGDGIKHLTKNYNAFPNLQQLVLNKNKIKTEGVKALINGHQCFPVLSGLFLNGNMLDENSIQQLTKRPGAFPLLDNLDLGQNQINKQQCDALSKITQIFPNLTQFGISRNGFGNDGIEKLFNNQTSFYNAAQLGLGNNGITGDGIKQMVKNGKSNFPNLTRLWVQNNDLKSDGCKFLARGNVFPNLVQLQIFSNEIGIDGILQLTKIQESFPKLQYLKAQNNLICDNGLKYLSSNYKAMPRLKQLYLDFNKITSDGIHNLVEKRQAFPCLKVLSLKNNDINSEGIKHMMYQCEAFFQLQKLFLQNNKIGDNGVQYFSQSLHNVFKYLEVLALKQNGLTSESIKHIVEKPEAFINLRVIGLNMNQIDNQGLQLLINSNLNQELPQLKNLWLFGNKIRSSDLQKFSQKYSNIKIQ